MTNQKLQTSTPASMQYPDKYTLVRSHYPKFADFVEAFTPEQCEMRYRWEMECIERCQHPKLLKIGELCAIYENPMCGELVIEKWLMDLNDYVNFRAENKLKPLQMQSIARIICRRFGMFNFAELTLLWINIKAGDYGPMYKNLSGEMICDCFTKFNATRLHVIAKIEAQKRAKLSMTTHERSSKLISGLLQFTPSLRKEIAEAQMRIRDTTYTPKRNGKTG